MLLKLWSDENGVILSAELVLIGTVLVVGMIVGLVELQCAVVAELSDVGDAIGNVDQSYRIPGITSYKSNCCIKAQTSGAAFFDGPDAGDCNTIISCDSAVSHGENSRAGRGLGGSSGGHLGPPSDFRDAGGRGPGDHLRGPGERRASQPSRGDDGRSPKRQERSGEHGSEHRE